MRLYVIRHADPDYKNNTITPAGHLEAEALAMRLSDVGIDKIYCSPMGRAKATAKYTSESVGIEAVTEMWAEELDHFQEIEHWGNIHVCDIPGPV